MSQHETQHLPLWQVVIVNSPPSCDSNAALTRVMFIATAFCCSRERRGIRERATWLAPKPVVCANSERRRVRDRTTLPSVMPADLAACQQCLAVCEKVGFWPVWMPKC